MLSQTRHRSSRSQTVRADRRRANELWERACRLDEAVACYDLALGHANGIGAAQDWARANGGEVRWLVPKQELKVTLPCGVVALTVDSRKAVVTGVHVWLSNPVAYKNGSPVRLSDVGDVIDGAQNDKLGA